MINGNIEKSLDLAGVQIHAQNTANPDNHQHLCHHLGRDRNARCIFTILAGIAVIRHDGCDPSGRGPSHRIHHDYQFHQVVVDRGAGRLDDEDIGAANIFLYLDKDLAVTEFFHLCLAERQVEMGGYIEGQIPVGVSGKYLDYIGHIIF